MKKINLLIITDTFIGMPGGSERHLLNFLNLLDFQSYNVIAVQLLPEHLDGNNVRLLNDISFLEHLHEPLNSIKSITFIKLFLKIKRIVKSKNIDIVISYHEKADVLNYLLSLTFRKAITHISSKRDLGFKLSGWLKLIMKYITPKFDAITTPSKSIKNMLTTEYGVLSEKIHVIPNGVDLLTYNSATKTDKNKFKTKLGIANESLIAISVGSLKEVKGHEFLIQSFHDFSKKSKHEWHLIIIGDGELEDELNNLCSNLEATNVHFMGLQQNVNYWLAHSDLIVSSSSSEGLSNALIEGIASSLAVIATNVGGNPELVHTKENGILVEFNNRKQLSEAFSYYDNNIKILREYGINSRRMAESCYANTIMVSRLLKLYSTLAKGVVHD